MLPRRLLLVASLVLGVTPATARAAGPIAWVVPGVGPTVAAPAPTPAAASPRGGPHRAAAHRRSVRGTRRDVPRIDHLPFGQASAARFVPLYRRAGATFGVSWRLLASI